jgi:hypothetical protein
MTAVNTVSNSSGVDSHRTLPPELLDGIAEAVATQRDPGSRSAVILGLVTEIYETVQWVGGPDLRPDEMASLAQVLSGAQEHQIRMNGSTP